MNPVLCLDHTPVPFLQQCPTRNKLPRATGRALKKISNFLHLAHFSPLISFPAIQTIIRVTKTGQNRVGFTVNSIKFSDNYCTVSCKLSCKPI